MVGIHCGQDTRGDQMPRKGQHLSYYPKLKQDFSYLTLRSPDLGEISFLNALPICAAANGSLPLLKSNNRLKLTKIPCAVSGRRKLENEWNWFHVKDFSICFLWGLFFFQFYSYTLSHPLNSNWFISTLPNRPMWIVYLDWDFALTLFQSYCVFKAILEAMFCTTAEMLSDKSQNSWCKWRQIVDGM